MREVWPEHLPLTARFGVIEYDGKDEQSLAESIELVKRMRASGLDLLNVSMGFSTLAAQMPWGTQAFLAPLASSWCIDDPHTAERVVADGQMDLVMIGRAHLADPHYPYQLALALGMEKPFQVLPPQYAYWLSRYQGPGKASAQ